MSRVHTLHSFGMLNKSVNFDEKVGTFKDDSTKDDTASRRDAVEKAVDKESGKDKEEEKKDTSKETKKEDEDEAEETDDDEVDPDEAAEAIKLFRALKSEDGPKLLKMLAREAGLDKDTTSKEAKEIRKAIKDIVKDKLGKDYQFLSAQLGEILEEIVPDRSAESDRLSKIEERLNNQERNALANDVDSSLKTAFEEYDTIPKNVQKRFNELIDEMPPVPGKTKPLIYFRRLIKIAAEETNTSLKAKDSKDTSQTIKDKIARNRRDASSHLASRGAEAEVDDTSKNASPPKSRREAVEQAARKVEEQMSKG